jgi:hypothetical protein
LFFFDLLPIPQEPETISTLVAEKTRPLLLALMEPCAPG